ncbi:MAG: YggT family protein [Gammaproteobacteria bacterium]|nr:YggT family protein [Gammaproteobacteria bacterium]
MSGGYVAGAAIFVLDTIFGLYVGLVLLRLLLQWARADFYNPLSQAVVKITNPLLRPLRRHIPAVGRIDSASVVLVVVLQLLNIGISVQLVGGSTRPAGLLVVALAALLSKVIYLLIFAILIQVVASWVAPGSRNPVLYLADSITAPVLQPLRDRLPALGGLDLSPMAALMGLQLAVMLGVTPLRDFGLSLL